MSRMAERLARAEARLKQIEDRDKIRIIIAPGTNGKPLVIDFRDPRTWPYASHQTKRSTPRRKPTRRKGRS